MIAIKDTRLTRPAQAAVIVLTPTPPHFELKLSPGKEAGPALSKVSAAFGQESGGHLVRTINPSRNPFSKGEYPFLFPVLMMSDTNSNAPLTQGIRNAPSSPLKAKAPIYNPFRNCTMTAQEHRQGLGNEMSGHYVGPVPLRDFLNTLDRKSVV